MNDTFRLKPPRIIPIHNCLRFVPDVAVTLRTSAISSGRRTTACVRHVCVQLRMIFLPSGKCAPFSLLSFVSSQPNSTFLAFVLVIYRSFTSSHLTLCSFQRRVRPPRLLIPQLFLSSARCFGEHFCFPQCLRFYRVINASPKPQPGRPGAAFLWITSHPKRAREVIVFLKFLTRC